MCEAYAWVWQMCGWPHGWDLPALAWATPAVARGAVPVDLPALRFGSITPPGFALPDAWMESPMQPQASAEHPEGRGGGRCSASSSCHAWGSKGLSEGEGSGSKTSSAGARAKPRCQSQVGWGIVARVPTSHCALRAAVSRIAGAVPAGPSPSSCWVSTRSLIWESKLQSGRPLLKEVSERRDVRKFHYVSCGHVRSRNVFFK